MKILSEGPKRRTIPVDPAPATGRYFDSSSSIARVQPEVRLGVEMLDKRIAQGGLPGLVDLAGERSGHGRRASFRAEVTVGRREHGERLGRKYMYAIRKYGGAESNV